MTPNAAPSPGRTPSRPAIAGLAAVLLLAVLAPGPATAGAAERAAPRGHSCCCGTVCRMGCCDVPSPSPHGGRPTGPSPAEAADLDDLRLDEPTACIGPMPCGEGRDAPPPFSWHRDHSAATTGVALPDLDGGRSPLPRSIDRLRPALPGDLPDEPPEGVPAGPRR